MAGAWRVFRTIAAALTTAAASISTAVAVTAPPLSPTTLDLYLDVFVNGVATGLMAHVRQAPNGALYLAPDPLRSIGLRAAPQALNDDGWINLSDLPGVHAHYDESKQTLRVQASDAAMLVRVLDGQGLGAPRLLADDTAQDAGSQSFGAFINHTLYANTDEQRWAGLRRAQYVSGLFEGNLYGRFGTFASTQLLNLNRVANASGQRHFRSTRLDTQWSQFDEDRLTTFTVGDFVGHSLSWSRSLRLGGLQWRRNFAIRPDLVTMPMLTDLSGSAAVPSTVELYINNAQRFAQDVTPGPFAITNMPLITGAGTARLVVRDALGRETVTETPFYASSQLLAKGLADFALETGVARRNYGVTSNDYSKRLMASATARYGLSNAVTLEGHAQGGSGLTLAGAGSVFKLGTLGVAGLAAAASRYGSGTGSGDETGKQLAGSVELDIFGVRLYGRHQRTQGDFNDLASITLTRSTPGTTAVQRYQRRVNARPSARMSQVSLALPHWFGPSVNLTYTTMTQHQALVGSKRDRTHTRLASVSVGQSLPGNGWLSISANRDLLRKKSTTVFASLSWFLGSHLSASVSRTWRDGALSSTAAEVSQSEQSAFGSVGWRLRSNHGHDVNAIRSQTASASYRSRVGRFEAGVEHMETDKTVHGRVQLDGALVLAGGSVFLANRIHDAFGVVNVGAPSVTVNYENTAIGKTDARGQLLLSELRAFEPNQISIDPMGLPVDAHIPVLSQTVRPAFKSGVTVDFRVRSTSRTALLTVRNEAGGLIPVGASVQINGVAAETGVGYDGLVWLEEIGENNRLLIKQQGKPECVVNFIAPAVMHERLVIPNAVCRRER